MIPNKEEKGFEELGNLLSDMSDLEFEEDQLKMAGVKFYNALPIGYSGKSDHLLYILESSNDVVKVTLISSPEQYHLLSEKEGEVLLAEVPKKGEATFLYAFGQREQFGKNVHSLQEYR